MSGIHPTLEVVDNNYVRLIKLDRPELKNAFNNAMYSELTAQLVDAQKSKDVRVLVITGKTVTRFPPVRISMR